MTGSIRAELLIMRKRTSTWILLALWTALALVFAYAVPYATYLNGSEPDALADVLPGRLVASLMGGFPFFGGVLALMLGVLTFGSEYGWGTLKTLFTQRPGRLHVFAAKLAALAATLAVFVLVVFALGAVAGSTIALVEGADAEPPSAWLVLRRRRRRLAHPRGVGCARRAARRALPRHRAGSRRRHPLRVRRRRASARRLATQVSLLDSLVELFVRAGGYSLVVPLGVSSDDLGDRGPGSFRGPFVDAEQAVATLGVYLALFVVVAAALLRRRDVV